MCGHNSANETSFLFLTWFYVNEPQQADTDLKNTITLMGKIAVAKRGGCEFYEKAERVARAGALGSIIVNTTNTMIIACATEGKSSDIPVVMIIESLKI